MFNLKFLSLLLFAFRIKFCFGSLELNNGVSKCSKEQFQCANGICIEKFKFCDYIVDCSDWSDEDTCASCDFEQSNSTNWLNWKLIKFLQIRCVAGYNRRIKPNGL